MKIFTCYSIPDAKGPGAGNPAILLIIMSYVTINRLDEIGNLIQLGGTVMGLTVGAVAAFYTCSKRGLC